MLIKAVEGETAPLRLLLGSDAVKIVNAELEAQRQEIEDWKELSVTTDFPAGSRAGISGNVKHRLRNGEE